MLLVGKAKLSFLQWSAINRPQPPHKVVGGVKATPGDCFKKITMDTRFWSPPNHRLAPLVVVDNQLPTWLIDFLSALESTD